MSNNTFASSVHFFALTNLDVRFHFNLTTFFLSFLAGISSMFKNSPLTRTVVSGEVDGFCPDLVLLLCIPCHNLLRDFQCHSQSHFQFCQALQISL